VKDFRAFSKQTGNELLSHAAAQKEFTFYLKRK
jgi:tRNA 2-thiouridine synthesizing protein A